MNNKILFDQIKDTKKNPKIARALEIFERTQKIYESYMKLKIATGFTL